MSVDLVRERTLSSSAPELLACMHRDRGILAGDFIKPDPALTRHETRKYLLAELERWLTGRICSHAREIAGVYPDVADLTASVEAGTWPAARLYTVVHLLEHSSTLVLPADYEERFQFAAEWCIDICADYLRMPLAEAVIPAAVVARGFVTTDTLPCGRVIESFWNHSPFQVLREAEATDADDEGATSLDDKIEAVPVSVAQLLTSEFTVRLPGWVFVTGFGVLAAYVWTVAMALSVRC